MRIPRHGPVGLALAALVVVSVWLEFRDGRVAEQVTGPAAPLGVIEEAFENGQSDIFVVERGRIVRLLDDDRDGARHQRFVVELDSGTTVLIAHNIDIAPRVPGLRVGESVLFRGEYEWNELGGVVHWTHHDPEGIREGGWLEYAGRRYE